MTEEIALFIDFENIRYSLINVQRREPDPQELIEVASRFGKVMVAKAYADWTRQPEFFKGSLTAAMIDRVDCPAKVRERFRQNNQQSSYYNHHTPFDRDARDGTHLGAGQETFDSEGEHEGEPYPEDAVSSPGEQALDERGPLAEEMNDGHEDADAYCEDDDEQQDAHDEPNYGFGASNPNGYGTYANGGGYNPQGNAQSNGNYGGYAGGGPAPTQQLITQSTVDLNMLMDIIETVFDRPTINTYVLMSGDRDFTRICARLKHRLNKRVIVVGVPGTVSRDLISAAAQFVPLGLPGGMPQPGHLRTFSPHQPYYSSNFAPMEHDDPTFIQFLDYIDRHWSWRTIGGVANFIGNPDNPRNRFRGRLTRDSARDLIKVAIDEGILLVTPDPMGGENLRLNREHPAVVVGLSETVTRP